MHKFSLLWEKCLYGDLPEGYFVQIGIFWFFSQISFFFVSAKNTLEKLVLSQISGDPSLSCGPVKDGFIKSSTRSSADFSTTTGTRVTVFDSNRVQESQFISFFFKPKTLISQRKRRLCWSANHGSFKVDWSDYWYFSNRFPRCRWQKVETAKVPIAKGLCTSRFGSNQENRRR